MKDILGTDIKLEDWDIVIKDGDIELVSGVDCLRQDLAHAFLTPLFYWGMSPAFGSRLMEFVGGAADPFFTQGLRRAVNEVFAREPRVQKDGRRINIYKRPGSVRIECEYRPVDRETPESLQFVTGGEES